LYIENNVFTHKKAKRNTTKHQQPQHYGFQSYAVKKKRLSTRFIEAVLHEAEGNVIRRRLKADRINLQKT
jgi:hypothetical protein